MQCKGEIHTRQRMRPWLEARINSREITGLEWVDYETKTFKVPWKQDSQIFKEWAVHTGRYREYVHLSDYPTWKTRFRCALTKLPDIKELKNRSHLDGQISEPYRVYQFINRQDARVAAGNNQVTIPQQPVYPDDFQFDSVDGVVLQTHNTLPVSQAGVSGIPRTVQSVFTDACSDPQLDSDDLNEIHTDDLVKCTKEEFMNYTETHSPDSELEYTASMARADEHDLRASVGQLAIADASLAQGGRSEQPYRSPLFDIPTYPPYPLLRYQMPPRARMQSSTDPDGASIDIWPYSQQLPDPGKQPQQMSTLISEHELESSLLRHGWGSLSKDGSESSEASSSGYIGDTESVEDFYKENTGIDLKDIIKKTLNKTSKDRSTLIQLEKDLVKFINEPKHHYMKFPMMPSHDRMLVHRTAAFFGLDHNVDQTGKCVIVNKTQNTRIPDFSFQEYINNSNAKRKMNLKPRVGGSFAEREPTSLQNPNCSHKAKSFEDRKQYYEEARRNIFTPKEKASSVNSIKDSAMSPDSDVIIVTLNMDTDNLLGMSIVGESNKGAYKGICVSSIMKGGAVDKDGRIEPGDLILEVNGTSFDNISHDEAVRLLREAVQYPGPITLIVVKCWDPYLGMTSPVNPSANRRTQGQKSPNLGMPNPVDQSANRKAQGKKSLNIGMPSPVDQSANRKAHGQKSLNLGMPSQVDQSAYRKAQGKKSLNIGMPSPEDRSAYRTTHGQKSLNIGMPSPEDRSANRTTQGLESLNLGMPNQVDPSAKRNAQSQESPNLGMPSPVDPSANRTTHGLESPNLGMPSPVDPSANRTTQGLESPNLGMPSQVDPSANRTTQGLESPNLGMPSPVDPSANRTTQGLESPNLGMPSPVDPSANRTTQGLENPNLGMPSPVDPSANRTVPGLESPNLGMPSPVDPSANRTTQGLESLNLGMPSPVDPSANRTVQGQESPNLGMPSPVDPSANRTTQGLESLNLGMASPVDPSANRTTLGQKSPNLAMPSQVDSSDNRTVQGLKNPNLGIASPVDPSANRTTQGQKSPNLGIASPVDPSANRTTQGQKSPNLGMPSPVDPSANRTTQGQKSPNLGMASPVDPSANRTVQGQKSPNLGMASPVDPSANRTVQGQKSPNLGMASHSLSDRTSTSFSPTSSPPESQNGSTTPVYPQTKTVQPRDNDNTEDYSTAACDFEAKSTNDLNNQNIEVVADLKLYKDRLLSDPDGRGTPVYEGVFEGSIPIAVKKIHLTSPRYTVELKEHVKRLREVETFRKMHEFNHRSIVRFLKSETTPDFLYIAFELCQGTLEDYVDTQANWSKELQWKHVLTQMAEGLEFLHNIMKLAHRDLKPSNVLLLQTQFVTKVVLADFGQSKLMANMQCSMSGATGSLGWIAPEVGTTQGRYYTESDIFSLGCLIYYVATGGKHPFGPNPIQRQSNILLSKSDLSILQPCYMCLRDLLTDMIQSNHVNRPNARSVSEHPSLMADDVIMDFLHKASNQINSYPLTQQNILEDPTLIPGGNWTQLLPVNTQAYLSTFTLARHNRPMFQGKEGSVRHLLRAIRNCSEHFKDLDATVRAEMGSSTTDHVEFWLTHFPWLLTHVYNKMKGDQCLMDSIRKS